jgi:RNA polymerase sigma-70 factor (ECF subfamily)
MSHAVEFAGLRAMLTATTGTARPDAAPGPAADVRAVADGDRDAFTRIYAAYGRMVRAILLGRVPRRDVDDLLQDVFITAYLRIGELRDHAAFGAWIAVIARNRATDHLRRSHDRDQAQLPPELPGGDGVEADTLMVLDAIRKLPVAYRETLLMRLVEGMTGAEISERTGLSAGSVRVNLHRGMKLLRERLGWHANE